MNVAQDSAPSIKPEDCRWQGGMRE